MYLTAGTHRNTGPTLKHRSVQMCQCLDFFTKIELKLFLYKYKSNIPDTFIKKIPNKPCQYVSALYTALFSDPPLSLSLSLSLCVDNYLLFAILPQPAGNK
jgi:hypothetical protein